jgi:hypothetical protein
VPLAALVDDRDLQAARQEGGLAQALLERVKSKSSVSKMSASGRKVIVVPVGSRAQRRALHQRSLGRAARVLLRPDVAVAADLDDERSDSALTTDTPTPCRPPETL